MEEIKVYCKRIGEPPIPLTVRLNWLPNGTIKPLVFMTPDGTLYRILRITEVVQNSYLREGGKGLRFKVQAKIVHTPDPDDEPCQALYQTYLYLADDRFCRPDIVDRRYGHAKKAFIQVTMDVFADGNYTLTHFRVKGERYQVEETWEIEPRGAFNAGGIGLWHKVSARLVNKNNDEDPDPNNPVTRIAALYWELNKWFISLKVS